MKELSLNDFQTAISQTFERWLNSDTRNFYLNLSGRIVEVIIMLDRRNHRFNCGVPGYFMNRDNVEALKQWVPDHITIQGIKGMLAPERGGAVNVWLNEVHVMFNFHVYLSEKTFSEKNEEIELKPTSNQNFTPGIDVSHGQGDIDWAQVKEAGYEFAFIKATEGMTFIDNQFANNWANAHSAGLLCSPYLFYRFEDNPETQAQHFIAIVKQMDAQDLPPMIDLEWDPMGKTPPLGLLPDVVQCCEIIKEAFKKNPIIYTNANFLNPIWKEQVSLSGYPLFVAGTTKPNLPDAWKGQNWSFWQNKIEIHIKGIAPPVDHDLFQGSIEDLKAFVAKCNL